MSVNIEEMRNLLLAKRQELLDNIVGLMGSYEQMVDPTDVADHSEDLEGGAVDALERQQEQLVLVNEQSLLREVEDALKRIEDGTYGRCIVCQQPIPEKRLSAIPWAARCVKDEEQVEQS